LRERLEDIAELAAHFVRKSSARVRVPAPRIDRPQLELLRRYAWPGNIRELQNVVERAVILARGGPLRLDLALPSAAADPAPRSTLNAAEGFMTERELRAHERKNLLAALAEAGWRIYGRDGAAALLGIKPTTLTSRMKALGIKRPSARSTLRH
jgi:DNA-binding NtrC family response regulator